MIFSLNSNIFIYDEKKNKEFGKIFPAKKRESKM